MDTPHPLDMTETLGAVPRVKDYRDVPFVVSGTPAQPTPSLELIPIWMQNKVGACTCYATGKYKQVLEFLKSGTIVPLSPRFTYTLCEVGWGGNINNQGLDPRYVASMEKQYGFATEDTIQDESINGYQEYVFNLDEGNVPVLAFHDASQRKIGGYSFPALDLESLKTAVQQAQGVCLLLQVGKEWWTAKDGTVTWNPALLLPILPPQSVVSGHEVYVPPTLWDGRQNFILNAQGQTEVWFINSWSNQWAQNGWGYFIYEDYLAHIVEALAFQDLPDALLAHLHELPPAGSFHHSFTAPIAFRDSGVEVSALQTALYIDGELAVDPSEFGFYGVKTAAAVKAFQYKYNISDSALLEEIDGRNVGALTRQKLTELFS